MATPTSTLEFTLRGRIVAWLAALAAAASWLGDNENARLAAAMLAAPLLVDLAFKPRRLPAVRIRVAARRTTAGALFTERVTVEHPGPRALRECMLAEPRTMRSEPPVLLPVLAPGKSVHATYRARSLQRSHVVERVFVLMSMWPLGMFRIRTIVPVAGDLVTEPMRIPLSAEVVRALAEHETAGSGQVAMPDAEFHSLREHQVGDDARSVHARRSASLGMLVRRVTHGRMPHTVGLVLDLRRPPGRPLHQGTRRFEWSLAACATLVQRLRQASAHVLVLAIDADPVTCRVRSDAEQDAFFTLLAEASPTPHRPLTPSLFDALQRLRHCFWIPAGAYMASPEVAAMSGSVTVVGGDFE